MVEVVVAEADDIILVVLGLFGVQQFAAIFFIGFDVDPPDHLRLPNEAESIQSYIFCSASSLMMISSTFCLTLSKRNWYCSFYILEMGNFPKIQLTVSNQPCYRKFLYVLFTIYSTMSSFVGSMSRFYSFIILYRNLYNPLISQATLFHQDRSIICI